jgi:hypothetical protein
MTPHSARSLTQAKSTPSLLGTPTTASSLYSEARPLGSPTTPCKQGLHDKSILSSDILYTSALLSPLCGA